MGCTVIDESPVMWSAEDWYSCGEILDAEKVVRSNYQPEREAPSITTFHQHLPPVQRGFDPAPSLTSTSRGRCKELLPDSCVHKRPIKDLCEAIKDLSNIDDQPIKHQIDIDSLRKRYNSFGLEGGAKKLLPTSEQVRCAESPSDGRAHHRHGCSNSGGQQKATRHSETANFH